MEELQRLKKLSGLQVSEEATDGEIEKKGSVSGSTGGGITVDDMVISMVTTESNEKSEPVYVYVDVQYGTDSYSGYAGDRETPDEPAGYDMDLANFNITKVVNYDQQPYQPSESELAEINDYLPEFLRSEYVIDLVRQEMSYYD
jgi:hypothetical protein